MVRLSYGVIDRWLRLQPLKVAGRTSADSRQGFMPVRARPRISYTYMILCNLV